ncbi:TRANSMEMBRANE PROTEIN [Salix koriyanagi]|uniref:TRANSMEMBRANE PROTEIN n=1 Tax=Salix koriyanagi TaxID=2511006 RepID=A0A9Q0QLD2_9ROSI|nr:TRANSMEMBRANE PROTEIN [Salix koriyanagi]
MSSIEFDRVKAEKADAMRRYSRKRNFYWFLEAVGALVLLWCFFSCFPNDTPFQTDIYDEYLSFSTNSSPRWKTATHEDKQLAVSSLLEKPVQVEEKDLPVSETDSFYEDKQIVCWEKAVYADKDEVEEKPVRDLKLLKDQKCFRRTRSARRTGKEIRECVRVLGRSATEIGRETSSVIRTSIRLNHSSPAAAKKSIQEMNSDEFRHTVDRYIANTKKIFREETIAMLSEEKEGVFGY